MKKTFYYILPLVISATISFGQSDSPCSGSSISAPNVTVNSSCTFTTYNNNGSSEQTNTQNGGSPSCGLIGEDVWLSFTAPASGSVTISTQSGTITDGVMSLYSGSCGSWTELDCSDDVNGLMPEITYSGLTPGTTYLIRFWEWGGGTGTFDLCISENAAASVPANDNCATATSLSVGVDGSCVSIAGTVSGGTNSGITSACFGTPNDDVWYSFVATDDTITIDRTANFDSEIEIFDACGGNSVACADAETPLMLTGLTVGSTYYIRVYSYFSGTPLDPTFDICLYDPAPAGAAPTNVSCGSMAPICLSNSITFTAEASGIPAESGNDYGCLFSQPDPTWYYLEISQAGNLIMDLTAASDVDFALWGPYASLTAAQAACGSYPTPIDCSYSSSATETISVTGVTVGEVYVLVVTNYAGVVQNINLTANGSNTANTDCSIVTCNADAGSW